MLSSLRVLGCRLRLTLLLAAVGPLPGAAQATGGMTTSLAMATEAAIRAVTMPAYPGAGYAGRDADGVPRYIQRYFSPEERRLLREHFGIEDPNRLYLSDTTAQAYLNYDTERDPGAGRLVRTYRVGAPSVRLPGETWEELERRLSWRPQRGRPLADRVVRVGLGLLSLKEIEYLGGPQDGTSQAVHRPLGQARSLLHSWGLRGCPGCGQGLRRR